MKINLVTLVEKRNQHKIITLDYSWRYTLLSQVLNIKQGIEECLLPHK